MKAFMKQPSKQRNVNRKTTENSLCDTKVSSLGHGRVMPYHIPEQHIFLVCLYPALNMISSIFSPFFMFFYRLLLILYRSYKTFNTIFPMIHTLQTIFFILIHLSQWLWDHLQAKANNMWQVITLFLLPLKRRMFMFVQGPHSIE